MYPGIYPTLPVRSSPGIYPTRELHGYYPDIYPPNTVLNYKGTTFKCNSYDVESSHV